MFKAPENNKSEPVNRELLSKYSELIYRNYGIYYDSLKLYLLKAKLDKLSAITGNLWDFYDQVSRGYPPAVDLLLKTITVGHTFFFREESHFEILSEEITKKKTEAPLIWCAASSTGEEPYSIAITLLEKGIEDFTIVSSDVNAQVLKVMNKGVYSSGKFSNTSRAHILKYFQKRDNDSYQIRKELRQYLRIKKLNLFEDIRFSELFDYIFCRNVMIYFDDSGRQQVIDNLVHNLKIGGLLFVGHTEALLNPPPQLKKMGHSMFIRTV